MHIKYYKKDIKELEITTLTDCHELFECIGFGLGDNIREHLIGHVNHTTNDKVENAKKAGQPEYKSVLDVYNEDKN